MNLHRSFLAILVPALLVLSSTATATDHLKLKSGRKLSGVAVSYDPDTEIVTFVTEANEELHIRAADLDRISAYKLAKTRAEKDNAADELLLGRFATDVELFAHANRHLENAEELDPALASQVASARVKLHTEAATFCMKNAREALADKDSKEAEEWLTTLVEKLPDEPLAAEAATMLEALYTENHAAQDDHLEESHTELLEKELKTGKKYYDAMLAGIQRGLSNTRTNTVAKREFERAWSNGERAMKELDKVEKDLSKDRSDLGPVFAEYRKLVRDHMVSAQLHLASMLSIQTNYNDAQKAVNRALSIDPENRSALAARARIENSANRGWRW